MAPSPSFVPNHGGRVRLGATSTSAAPTHNNGGWTSTSTGTRTMGMHMRGSSSPQCSEDIVGPAGGGRMIADGRGTSDVSSLVTTGCGGGGGGPSWPMSTTPPPLAVVSPSSSSWISSSGEAVATPTTTVFEPTLPDAAAGSLVAAFVFVALLSAAAASIWANDVVPLKRTELAASKNRGEVREYLDELNDAASLEEDIGDEERDEVGGGAGVPFPSSSSKTASTNSSRRFERWLFADWLSSGNAGRKDPALPFLKKAKWNSGDNPVLVATGLILVGVLIASVTERVF